MYRFVSILAFCIPVLGFVHGSTAREREELYAQADDVNGVTPGPTTAAPMAAPVADVPTTPQTLSDTESLSDEKILEVTKVANAGEIAQAKLASTRAQDPEVRRLARMIALDHAKSQRRMTQLSKDKNMTPLESATASRLQSDSENTLVQLGAQNGAAFDRAYIDAQVKEHAAVLKLIDNRLMPNAKQASVKALVASMRPGIERHLEQAKALQQKIDK